MHKLESELVLRLIGRIYDAALDPGIWPAVVCDIAGLQRAHSALLLTSLHSPAQGGFTFPHNFPQNLLQLWADKYIEHDLWTQNSVKRNLLFEGNVATDREMVDFEEFLQSRGYKELMSKINAARVCAGVVFGLNSPGVLPTAISVYRGVADEPFGADEVALHRVLVPHLSRSLGIMFRLRDAELRVAATLAALDRLTGGVVLIGAQRAVAFANQAARGMLGEEDGLRLRQAPTGKGFLAIESADAQRALDAALDQCLDFAAINVTHFSKVVPIPRQSGRAAYLLNVSALPLKNEFGTGLEQPRAIAFLTDPAKPLKVDEEALRKIYGLTAAECRLTAEICTGQSIFTIASQLGVSENTVKTQLQSIFDKTGTHRQAELVKLMLALSSRS